MLVETLIAFPPLLFLFFCTLQLTEAYAAKLLVRRAAGAAVRAAVVVFSDDPQFYDCGDARLGRSPVPPRGTPCMMADVVQAARIVLGAGRGFDARDENEPLVNISGSLSGHSLVTAQVTASYKCFVPPLSLACGLDGKLELSASASLPYQEADYEY